ncbi:MAG: type II secretion system F family protein [Thermoplasmata archaeon]|nr:type II secretion system F family protein [Thermoplasmata archaeon]
MRRPGLTLVLLALVVGVGALIGAGSAHAAPVPLTPTASGPLTITPTNPLPGSVTNLQTPTITASFSDSASQVDPTQVTLFLDGFDDSSFDGFKATPTGVSFLVPSILKLKEGLHNVTVKAADKVGNTAQEKWNFTVNTSAVIGPSAPIKIAPEKIILYVALGIGVAASCFGGYIFYLQQAKRFTFRKYFATHPVRTIYVVLYVPVTIAVLFVIIGLLYVYNLPFLPPGSPDYVIIVGIFIALTAFAFYSRRERQQLRAYERAFAQFLFEMADAMRGGLDPAKAMVELSKTQANIMRKPLRIAADGIQVGRPFEDVLKAMVEPMKSALISRYANLIGEAATVGGETSIVIYRAAKDMDDFIKIEAERAGALYLPVVVLYIAFAVLMAVLFALLYIAPSIGTLNVGSAFGSASPLTSGVSGQANARLDPATLKERFFDLMLINSLGTGIIIGAFTEGRARDGLIHSLGLVAATTVAFALFPILIH